MCAYFILSKMATIMDLPDETLLTILRYLPFISAYSFQFCSKRSHKLFWQTTGFAIPKIIVVQTYITIFTCSENVAEPNMAFDYQNLLRHVRSTEHFFQIQLKTAENELWLMRYLPVMKPR